MPKRKLSELEEDDPTSAEATTTSAADTTASVCGDVKDPEPTITASPASPTECTSSCTVSCVPEAVGDGDVPGCSTDTNGPSTSTDDGFTQIRKKRKSVKFNGVTVYYFSRKQGFICVPSQGGSTLGMSETHMQQEKFSVSEYARAQRRLHKQILREQQKAAGIASKRSTRQKSDDSSSVTSDTSSDSEEELNVDDYYFLQPVPTRQRRILLRQSGIKKIDTVEKEECRDIRTSREMCGCDCRVYCDPETCACSIEGIKCQVDRLSFPCGCSKDGCSNPVGRIEFNPIRVRTHFIHTVMRLEMDRKREQITQMCAPRTTCDYPQTTREGDSSTQQHMEENCNGDGDTQENMDLCESEMRSPDRKIAKVSFTENCEERDSGNDNANQTELNESNPQSKEPPSSPKPKKSCLKRRPDSKNLGIVTQYNSNERGSCRDCGSTDVTEMLMAGAHFVESATPIEMEPIIPSQTKIVDCTNTSDHVSPDTVDASSQQHGDNCQQQHYQQVMLFGDGEEEEYAAENGNMYGFKPEDSSYSESSDPDCCSEGSEDSAQPQANGQFNPCTNTTEANSVTTAHYCIPGSSYEASTAQPEQKYMDLNSSTSGYKLEPISEILNPLRFANYESNSLGHQGWHTANTTSYQFSDSSADTLPRYPARYPSMQQQPQQHQDNAQPAGSAIGNQGYYSAAEQSSTNLLPYQHPPHQNNQNNNANNYHNNGTLPCISTSQNIVDKSVDVPFNQSESSVVKDTDEDSGFKDLSAASSTASSPVKDEDDVTPKYHDLTSTASVTKSSQFTDLRVTSGAKSAGAAAAPTESSTTTTVTSDDDTNCRYTTLLSPTRHNSQSDTPSQSVECAESKKCEVQLEGSAGPSLYQELDEEYILPKRTSVVAVATDNLNSSPNSQNEIKSTEIENDQGKAGKGSEGKLESQEIKIGKVVNEVSSSRESQNFGEIIKESIVETVSA